MSEPSVTELKKWIRCNNYEAFDRLWDLLENPKGRMMTEKEEADIYHFLYLNCYKLGYIQLGQKLLERMFNRFDNPHILEIKATIIFNAAFYINPLNARPSWNFTHHSFPKDHAYHNPFLFKDRMSGDYVVGVRVVNLRFNKGSNYEIFIINGKEGREKGRVRNVFALVYDFKYPKHNILLSKFCGVEDIRTINTNRKDKDRILASGTTMDTHKEGTMRMSLFYLYPKRDVDGHIVYLEARDLVPLRGHEDTKKQKNWLPVIQTHDLYFIYGHYPFTVLKADLDLQTHEYNGNVSVHYEDKKKDPSLNGMRGSTAPIPYKNEKGEHTYLYIIHYTEGKNKIYYHRFVEMDISFTIKRISALFYFERNNAVEYAVSMLPYTEHLDLGNTFVKETVQEYLITYGVQDKIARMTIVSRDAIEDLFKIRSSLLE